MGGSASKKTMPNSGDGPYAPSTKKFHRTYALSRELGHGAFSVVRLGVHKVTGDSTAVKILQTKKMGKDEMEALRQEIEILHELSHPHIIKIIEVFDESEMYLVTELVSGGELFDRIVSKTYYTEKEARDLIKIFLTTMKYLHDRNIVHRDIKPENLLLQSDDDDANIKLADFGFAKRVEDLTDDEEACGTPNYVAPEILRGDKYGCEADIWSMGVVCYILLAGYAPFYDEDQKKLFEKIKKGKFHFHEDYWSRMSPDAIDLIKKMMTVDQKKRWTADQLLEHKWITASDSVLGSKDISSTIQELRKYNARRRLRAAMNAVIMANRIGNMIGLKPAWMKEDEKERKEKEAAARAALSPEELKALELAEKEDTDLANAGAGAGVLDDEREAVSATVSADAEASAGTTPNPEVVAAAPAEAESVAEAEAAAEAAPTPDAAPAATPPPDGDEAPAAPDPASSS